MSAKALALYSLAAVASIHRVSAFSPSLLPRSLSPALATHYLVVVTSSRTFTTSTALQTSANDDSGENGPQYQTFPLPPLPSLTSPSILQKLRLKLGFGKALRERLVHKYFNGVDTQNIQQIAECFHPDGAIIRDVCALTNKDVPYDEVGRLVSPEFLGERCREFLVAHPDADVLFHYG